MKTSIVAVFSRLFFIFSLAAFYLSAPFIARAGLTFELHIYRDSQGQNYNFFTPLSTNTTPPDVAVGMYFVSSPQWPTNGSTRQYEMTANGFNPDPVSGAEHGYGDFNSMMQQITNGTWTILFTNATTTNLFSFTVSAPNMTSNMLPATIITHPANGEINVENQPTFTWQGPSDWPVNGDAYVNNYDNSFDQSDNFPATQNNWTIPTSIPNGMNCTFRLQFITNNETPVFVATTPLDTDSQPIAGWISTSVIETGGSISFAVTNPVATSPVLIAHYTFDDGGNLGADSSGNGYDLDFNGGDGVSSSDTAEAGGGAAYFDGGSFFSYNSTPINVLNTLAGGFSISFWINTTQDDDNEGGAAYAGDGIVAADIPGQHYDLVPAALDGGEIGFNTGPYDDTVNSVTDINDGNYHHVVITRNQTTGEKQVYIDGVLDNSDFDAMNPLSDPKIVAIGCAIDASQSDPNNINPHQYFQGLLDDLQIYSGVLSANDVENLYANPGSTAGGFGGGHKNVAHYTFDDSDNLGQDSSGNGNDMNGETYWGPQHEFNADAVAGGGAIQFFGTDAINPAGQALTNLNAVLAGSFTFSAWVKTTVTNGADYNNAYFGAVIFWAYNDHGNTNDTIPLAITGSKAAFTTRGGDSGDSDNLHSFTSVNDGNYHLITVTRDATTGEKKIYVDGNFETSQTGTTNPLNGNNYYLTIGGRAYILESDTVTNYSSFNGLLDDLQIYSGVLSDAEIASLYANPGTTVPDVAGGPTVHYDFDEGTALAADVSGNNNNIVYAGNFGGDGPSISSDTAAGLGSVSFDGGSYLTASPNLLATLAGSFTMSLWVKTTQDNGDPNDVAWTGDAIISADIPYSGANDLIPVALTGGQIAFNTANTEYDYDDTINSSATVNDGNWHHVVVGRNQPTGEKFIYIDGVLDTSDIDATNLLNDPKLLTIGCKADASNPDPSSPTDTGENGYVGLLDDVQIYDRVLSPGEVTYLYDHPGAVIAGLAGSNFATALNTTNLTWTSGGDLPWFTETATTHDGLAAQSGPITDSQSSYLQTTVPADGHVSFYWKVSSEDGWDYLTFYTNGVQADAISGDVDWNQENYSVSAGDVLRWEYSKDGSDSDGLDTGFLDEVNYAATLLDTNTPPVITLNPFSQTNSPGYNVALLAVASGIPDPTLQWFKVGSGAIFGATNALYIPTNSGNASVEGSYYAVASNLVSSANTTTAAVSFVSAPFPPDWSRAFKSPFQAQDSSLVTKDYYYGAILDVSNNIYTAAEFGGNVAIGSTNLESGPGGDAAAIVKQTSAGSALWVATITNNGDAYAFGECVAPAPGGGVYLSGDFNGTNWLGTNQLTDAGGGDIFLARFDANGSNVWIKTVGSTNGDFTVINALASDPAGNVTLSGLLGSGPVSIGGTNYDITGQEGVLVQFDQTGAVRWSQILPGELPQYLAYSAGRLYVSLNTTTTTGETNIIIGGITNATDRSWGLACLNATNGQAIWTRGVGAQNGSANGNPYATDSIDDVPRIAVSGANVFITGVAYDTSATFDSLTVNFDQARGLYFARYDTNGNAQVATTYGSVTATPFVAAADAGGNVYVSGDFDTYAVFGANILAAPNNRRPFAGSFSQAFLAKFDRNGNPLWARQAVSPATVNFLGIALAPDGVWASGYCISTNTSTGYTPTWFGTNFVYGDTQAIVSGEGIGASITFTGYPGGVLAKITDIAVIGSPVTLLNPQNNGTNFQFSFLSQFGITNAVQYRTNLSVGDWLTYSNVVGDGTLKTVPVPHSVFSPAQQGFIRVSTQ